MLGQNLAQCHSVRHKSRRDRPGVEPGPPQCRSATDRLNHGIYFEAGVSYKLNLTF